MKIGRQNFNQLLRKSNNTSIKLLLSEYKCPVAFHTLRTLMMGNIAISSEKYALSRMQLVASLWGGKLPKFRNSEDEETLLTLLTSDLWEALQTHTFGADQFTLMPIRHNTKQEHIYREIRSIRSSEINGFLKSVTRSQVYLPQCTNTRASIIRLNHLKDALETYNRSSSSELLNIQNEGWIETVKNSAESDMNKIIQGYQNSSVYKR